MSVSIVLPLFVAKFVPNKETIILIDLQREALNQ